MDAYTLSWKNYTNHMPAPADVSGDFHIGRIATEDKQIWHMFTENGDTPGIVLQSFYKDNPVPKVGDWVVFEKLKNENKARIYSILPRFSKISRKDPSSTGRALSIEQVLAVNIDKAFLIQGLDANLNLNRMERYIVSMQQGGIEPIAVFNKQDLVEDFATVQQTIKTRLRDIQTFFVSAKTLDGITKLKESILPGETIIFLGSSGVGKSSLLNAFLEADIQKTADVRMQDARGKHTTTRRQMFIFDENKIIIDTPGMRELQLVADEGAVNETFDDFYALSSQCKFSSCDHAVSAGCAIRAAVESGVLAYERYKSFIKLLKETEYQTKKDDRSYVEEKKRFWKKIAKFTKHMGE